MRTRSATSGHGDWIRLLRANGFEVQDLIELWPPEGTDKDGDFITAEWARALAEPGVAGSPAVSASIGWYA